MVARTRLSVTFYVHCLSCSNCNYFELRSSVTWRHAVTYVPKMEAVFPTKSLYLSTRLYGVELYMAVVLIFTCVRVWNFRPLLSVSETIFPSAWTCSLCVEQMLVFVANLLFRTVTWGVSRSCVSLLHLHFVHHQYLVFIKQSIHIVRGSSDTPPCSYEYVATGGFTCETLMFIWRWKRPTKRNAKRRELLFCRGCVRSLWLAYSLNILLNFNYI
jgi:hypothetical protein